MSIQTLLNRVGQFTEYRIDVDMQIWVVILDLITWFLNSPFLQGFFKWAFWLGRDVLRFGFNVFKRKQEKKNPVFLHVSPLRRILFTFSCKTSLKPPTMQWTESTYLLDLKLSITCKQPGGLHCAFVLCNNGLSNCVSKVSVGPPCGPL